MNTSLKNLTIGALAGVAGVSVETVRFYQRKCLMPEPDRPPGSIRRYGAAELARVQFIKAAQRLGFTLDEVAELLKLEDGTHCHEALELAKEKLNVVRARLDDLRRIESVLDELVTRCGAAQQSVKCPLMSSLQQG